MTSELAQARQLTVVLAITAVRIEVPAYDQYVSPEATLVLFGDMPMTRGVA